MYKSLYVKKVFRKRKSLFGERRKKLLVTTVTTVTTVTFVITVTTVTTVFTVTTVHTILVKYKMFNNKNHQAANLWPLWIFGILG